MVSLCPLISFYLPQTLDVMFFSYGFIILSRPRLYHRFAAAGVFLNCGDSCHVIVFISIAKVTLQTGAEKNTVDGNAYGVPSEADLACLGLFLCNGPSFSIAEPNGFDLSLASS